MVLHSSFVILHSSIFILHPFPRRNTFFVFTTRSPTFDPIVRATSVKRSATAAAGAALVDCVALRLAAFFAAGRLVADFFFAVLPLLFLLGIPLPRLSRAVYDKNEGGPHLPGSGKCGALLPALARK
jgi:hypothetical protein